MKFLKFLFPILLFFSLKTYSQEKNPEDNLINTVLILKSGKKFIGKFKSSSRFCLAPTYKTCVPNFDEIFEKVDTIKLGYPKKYLKKNKNRKRIIQIRIGVAEYLKKIKYKGNIGSDFSILRYKGNNYDFYYHTTQYVTTMQHHIFITKPNSYDIIGHTKSSFSDKKTLIKALKQVFPKCRAIKNALDKKMFKKKEFNVYEVLDKCVYAKTD